MIDLSDRQWMLESGEDPVFGSFRRPGILSGPNGRIIACYEGHRRDPQKQHLISRISDDAGEHWSDRIVLAEGGATGMLHNVMLAWAEGWYYCLWNVQYRQLWVRRSRDGVHWESPRDLTRSIWRADCDYPWNAFGIGSGHCTTLENGRILIPTWFTTGGDSHKPSAFGCIYTDDLFETIRIGRTLADGARLRNPNEGAIARLGDGKILATVRHDNDQRLRALTASRDGVDAWQTPWFCEQLPDPICHAAMLGLNPDKDGVEGLLFSNCAYADPDWRVKYEAGLSRYLWSDDARKNLVVRFSRDGVNFSQGIRLADKAGYSDLACAADTVVCIYETAWNLEETCVAPHALGVARVPLKTILSEP